MAYSTTDDLVSGEELVAIRERMKADMLAAHTPPAPGTVEADRALLLDEVFRLRAERAELRRMLREVGRYGN